MSDQDLNRGIYDKYDVKRVGDITGKHDNCRYFVLDPLHDPIARAALDEYAREAYRRGYFDLATDIYDWLFDLMGNSNEQGIG